MPAGAYSLTPKETAMTQLQLALSQAIPRAIQALDFARTHRQYWDQNECVFLARFLPPAIVAHCFLPAVERLRPEVHRSYLPWHKKGGSVSYYTLAEKAPIFLALYRSTEFLAFLSRLVQAPLQLCPDTDPHACALYFYSEPGDHIGFHYDTSYYQGARYTVLLGLVQRSAQCQLVCQLYTEEPTRPRQELQLATAPGSLVIFNGNRLWHAVTPLEAGAERVVLTMEYVTNPAMPPLKRFISTMKDAIAYFGFSTVLRGGPPRGGGEAGPRARHLCTTLQDMGGRQRDRWTSGTADVTELASAVGAPGRAGPHPAAAGRALRLVHRGGDTADPEEPS
jgi:alkylated DNA repair dioxygenase AlkB